MINSQGFNLWLVFLNNFMWYEILKPWLFLYTIRNWWWDVQVWAIDHDILHIDFWGEYIKFFGGLAMLIQKIGIVKLIPLTKYFPYNIIFLFMAWW
jgi:hypothetical protein